MIYLYYVSCFIYFIMFGFLISNEIEFLKMESLTEENKKYFRNKIIKDISLGICLFVLIEIPLYFIVKGGI